MVALGLNSNRVSKMKNSPFPGLDFLERPPWSELLLEATLLRGWCFVKGQC